MVKTLEIKAPYYNGHGFGRTPGVGDGQGGLECCGSWSHQELDMTEWLNWTELNYTVESWDIGKSNKMASQGTKMNCEDDLKPVGNLSRKQRHPDKEA